MGLNKGPWTSKENKKLEGHRKKDGGGFLKLCWIVTLIATALAAWQLVADLSRANEAPQQAAAAAIALSFAIIPYIFTRCVEKLSDPEPREVKVTNWPERE